MSHEKQSPEYSSTNDKNLDANLRAAAPLIGLPADPTPAQATAWQSDRPPAALHAPDRQPRTHRRLGGRRWFAGISAAAATVAAGAALLLLGGGNRVQASTILGSLRSANIQGLKITLTNVSSEGATVNGEFQVRLAQPVAFEDLLQEEPDINPEPSQIFLRLDVAMGNDGPVPGLSARIEGALTSESTWIFARSSTVPLDQIPHQHRAGAAIIGAFLRNGVLLDLGANAVQRLGELEMLDEAGGDDVGAHARVEVRVGAPDADEGDDAGDANLRVGGNVNIDPALNQRVRSLLTGQASAADLAEIEALLQGAAEHATVSDLGNGRYLLTASGFDGPGRMQVSYTQGTGVQWVELDQFPDIGGTVRIEMLTTPIDGDLLDKNRLIVPNQTMQIDEEWLRQWGRLFGAE